MNLCACGCKQEVSKEKNRFIYGHQNRGKFNSMYNKHHSLKARKRISKGNLGKKNGRWKGKNASYEALHIWVRRYKPKPKVCNQCKNNLPYEVHNINGKYNRDLTDWEWLCKKCHIHIDRRWESRKRDSLGKFI